MKRILGVLSVAAFLAACGGTTKNKTDLAGNQDLKASGDMASAGTKADGEVCTTNGQCLGGVCSSDVIQGKKVCASDCSTDGTCAGGGIAVGDGAGGCNCLKECTKSTDCITGAGCEQLVDQDGMPAGAACGNAPLDNCDPTAGDGSCKTNGLTPWVDNLPGGCIPFGGYLDENGKEFQDGICFPRCIPGVYDCSDVTLPNTVGVCSFVDATKDDKGAATAFKYKGTFCGLVDTGTDTLAAGDACDNSSAATESCGGDTACELGDTGTKCRKVCTYAGGANDAGKAVGCTGGQTCHDVQSLGASAAYPIGLCQ